MADHRSDLARYEDVDRAYLDRRRLRPSAGWILLWALGVGAVISGDFFGWNYGLKYAGFNGLAIATVLMAVMYICMVFTIAELSAALPHAGGFFSFTRNALGPLGGFVCGLTDTIEYVVTPAVIVVGIGEYLNAIVFTDPATDPGLFPLVWWALAYTVFVVINVMGVELTLRFGLIVTGLAAAVLVVFYAAVITSGSFDSELLYNIPPDEGHTADGLPHGWLGVFAALPFAIWFYLAIEQLPLAAEESHDVVRDMPRALLLGIITLLVLSLLTLVLNTGVGGGAAALSTSGAPLEDGFRAVFDNSATSRILGLVALTGLVASFHTIIYAYGRVLFALSRAGYFPRWISITGQAQTPWVALVLGAVIGLGLAAAIHFSKTLAGDESTASQSITVAAVLLNMAVFGAVLSYILVMISYIVLKITRPEMPRPYRSPLGIPGAAVGTILSVIALAATFSVDEFRPGMYGVAIFLVIGVTWFLCYSRHHLVAQAPEEEVALLAAAQLELTRDDSPDREPRSGDTGPNTPGTTDGTP
ncbi:MAG: ethanolamine permease [Planctomycetaceae bacterium]|nr:ethanolamine permease [Planctomycetaceae bacterium]